MKSSLEDSVSRGKLPAQQREAMVRLLESSTFSSAPRLRSVLTHLMQALEQGLSDSVTEQSIGQAVFGKPAGYNASEDNIVRVTIRHLRSRLDEYYNIEGAAESLILVIPKGKYIPSFMLREVTSPSAAPAATPTPDLAQLQIPDTQHLHVALRTGRPTQELLWVWLVIAVAVLLSFLVGYFLRPVRTPASHAGGIVAELFPTGDNISLVTVDANLEAYRQIFGKQVSLSDYTHRDYAKEDLKTNDPRVVNARVFATGDNETNVSSVIVAAAFRQVLEGRRLAIKHPHDVSVRDFQNQGNVILLGGPWIDPWGQLFENRFNFRLVPRVESPSTSEIHNRQASADEEDIYRPHMDGSLSVNYVRVAIVPNLDNTGHVILLSATSAESLEAAGEYLLSMESSRELLSRFQATSVNMLPPLELLLEVKGLNAAPGNHRIIAARPVN